MTSMTSPSFRQLASFTVRSEPGNERLALAQVAEAIAGEGLAPARLERLKTAVAETAMNAIEHGNRNQPLTLLVRAGRRQRLAACGLSEHYREILELTRLDEAITIYTDEASALADAVR